MAIPTIRNNRGFTAVEIAMVASVIAILALLVLPIFRQRAEEAREAAVQDELDSMTKALLLIEADMPGGNFIPQLSDLDNRRDENVQNLNNNFNNLAPPVVRWRSDGELGQAPTANRGEFVILSEPEFLRTVVQNWQGPYASIKKSISLAELDLPAFDNFTQANQGPILIPSGPFSPQELQEDRYPVDPWGNPYLLFGPGETIYNTRAIYSLGPNGVPGDDIADNPASYTRTARILGTADDFSIEF